MRGPANNRQCASGAGCCRRALHVAGLQSGDADVPHAPQREASPETSQWLLHVACKTVQMSRDRVRSPLNYPLLSTGTSCQASQSAETDNPKGSSAVVSSSLALAESRAARVERKRDTPPPRPVLCAGTTTAPPWPHATARCSKVNTRMDSRRPILIFRGLQSKLRREPLISWT